MPWTYVSDKDGTTMTDIPDNVNLGDAVFLEELAKIRASKAQGTPPAAVEPPVESEPGAARMARQALPGEVDQSTLEGGMGAVVRGAGPQTVMTAINPVLGGIYQGATMVMDPVTELLNTVLPPEMKQLPPSQGVQWLLTQLGVANPQTEAERILQAGAAGVSGGAGTIRAGQGMQQLGGQAKILGAETAGVGERLAAAPAQQIAGGAAGGVASQGAAEAGADPLAQLAAGVAGGAVGGTGAAPKSFPKGAIDQPGALPSPAEAADFGELVKRAAKFGHPEDKRKLAEMAKINPEARAAADRLGIELPIDVFSDNPQFRQAAGLTRSLKAGEAESQFTESVLKAVDKADQIMAEMGTVSASGRPSVSVVSEQVLDKLKTSHKELKDSAAEIYAKVDEAIPRATPVTADNLRAYLGEVETNLGGVEGMYPEERALASMLKGPITYERLMRVKRDIGEAQSSRSGPYRDMTAASLAKLYGAIAKDQKANVEALGGSELVKDLDKANIEYGKMKQLEEYIAFGFGKDEQGGIGAKLQSALISAKKDPGPFNRLMETIPEELKPSVIATGLASISRAKGGMSKGDFGFSEYVDAYQGLRASPKVYAEVVKNLGDGSDQILRDLYQVSKRITDARAAIERTGKANQAMAGTIDANSLIGNMLKATARTAAVGAGATAGPIGAVGASVLADSLMKGSKSGLEKAGKLFISPKFEALVTKVADKAAIEAVATSPEFKAYADAVGLPKSPAERYSWLVGAMASQKTEEQPQQGSASDRARAAQRSQK